MTDDRESWLDWLKLALALSVPIGLGVIGVAAYVQFKAQERGHQEQRERMERKGSP